MTALTPVAPLNCTDHTEEQKALINAARRSRMVRGENDSAVVSVLARSAVSELRRIEVTESDQSIYLSGRVRSFYHKQLAQEAIRPVAAGRQVFNRVDVCESV
ncbi:BON domain-containing protein [Allorhodopirellula heiligendammensis]|uniref:BON domain protein n=1 Tax=Allorhodopirellula heiligendammensis TaxID=2714739 RepID=A0A5C6CAA4_9BACT|nr:BON domain-containing protein [Allorhodopirellula heiligendammensis]TWU19709.1 BON domain protein [Allorhodopirellula heiligendammensis]